MSHPVWRGAPDQSHVAQRRAVTSVTRSYCNDNIGIMCCTHDCGNYPNLTSIIDFSMRFYTELSVCSAI